MNAVIKFSCSLCGQILLFSGAVILLQHFQTELLFQRDAINEGEVWRILSGNMVHTNYYHALINLAGLLFICLLFRDYLSVKTFYLSLIITAIAVGIGIYFFSEQLIWYAGLSGALYGLYMIAASLALRHKDYLISLPLLAGIPAKLFWDSQHQGLTQQSAELIGAPVATDAHWYGLLAGILISISSALMHKASS